MYYVVFQNAGTKVRRFVGFTDEEQFEQDYLPEQGGVIAKGIEKKKVDELCDPKDTNSKTKSKGG